MKDCKVMCVESSNKHFVKGKEYDIENDRMTTEHSYVSYMILNGTDFKNAFGCKFELVEETKQFTLDDIQDGDICVRNDGYKLLMDGYWITRFNQDLTHIKRKEYDIKEVLRPQTIYKAPEYTIGQQMLIDAGLVDETKNWGTESESGEWTPTKDETWGNEDTNCSFGTDGILDLDGYFVEQQIKAILTRLEELESE